MKAIQRCLPGLLVFALACQGSSFPDLGSIDRFFEDPVVGDLISQKLEAAYAQPELAEPWIQLGIVFEANDYLPEAIRCYDYALGIDGGSARTWYRLGSAQVATGDHQQAVQAFSAAIEADPDYPPTYWRRGHSLLRLGENERATMDFRRALELDESQFPAILGLARALLDKDTEADAGEAFQLLQPLVQRFPRLRSAHTLLGLAHRRLGNTEAARYHLEMAGDGASSAPSHDKSLVFGRNIRDPWQRELGAARASHRTVIDMAGRAFMAGDYETAITTLEDLRRHRPDDVTLGLNLATTYRQVERNDEAVALLQSLHQRHPQRFQLAMDLAWSLFEADDHEAALAMAQRAAAIDPQAKGPELLQGRIDGTIPEPPAISPPTLIQGTTLLGKPSQDKPSQDKPSQGEPSQDQTSQGKPSQGERR